MLKATNAAGETLADGIRRIGGDPSVLDRPLRGPGGTAAFVELHIEQGPVLEARGIPVGVVTDIVGIRRYKLKIEGRPDHAGTTPMTIRRDALVGAARIIDAVSRKATQMQEGSNYVVATIGHLTLSPNASNAVPGRVEMILEVRSDNHAVLESFANHLIAAIHPEIEALRLSLEWSEVSRSIPTSCSSVVIELIEEAAKALSYPSLRMPSGAGHDAVYMSKTGPAGMIFIPCLKGRSHCPEEWIEPEQLLIGAQVLYQTILHLDRRITS
jgi:N-carbamoyl-L-amino-acid hydrolase